MNKEIKVYKVDGGEYYADYGVVSFENKYSGQNVGKVCESLLNGKDTYSTPEEDEDFTFGITIDKPILESEVSIFMRMRDRGDYDDLKNEKLFLETETI